MKAMKKGGRLKKTAFAGFFHLLFRAEFCESLRAVKHCLPLEA
jgi:hypothetical protein